MALLRGDGRLRSAARWRRLGIVVSVAVASTLAIGVEPSQGSRDRSEPAFSRGGTLTTAAYGQAQQGPTTLFPVLNPPVDTTAEISLTLDQIWRPLIWVGTNLKVDWSRSVASSVTPNAADTVYTVKMHRNYRWPDGSPVTASDQLYEWNLIKADCPSTSKCSWFYASGYMPSSVVKFRVTGKFEFKLFLNRKLSPNWFELNGLTSLAPLPAQAWSVNPTTHAKVCSDTYCSHATQALADFKLLSRLGKEPTNPIWQVADGPFLPGPWVTNQSYTLLRNPKYTGGHKAYLDKIVFQDYTSDQAEFEALKAASDWS